VSVKTGVPTIH